MVGPFAAFRSGIERLVNGDDSPVFRGIEGVVESVDAAIAPETQEAGTPVAAPPPGKKSKVAKDIAKAIIANTPTKAEQLGKKLMMDISETDSETLNVERLMKNIKKKKDKISHLDKKFKVLKLDQKRLEKELIKSIKKLRKNKLITGLEADENNRIIITTAELSVQKPGWSRAEVIGKYQIRIDFSETAIENGIRILNITKRYQDIYDSPTIKNTKCCWGNVYADIHVDFETQDLHELVIDLLDYIQSPNDDAGYLGWANNGHPIQPVHGKGGWEQWFSSLITQPEGFCFEKYNESSGLDENLVAPNGAVASTTEGEINGELYSEAGPRHILRDEVELLRQERQLERQMANMYHEASQRLIPSRPLYEQAPRAPGITAGPVSDRRTYELFRSLGFTETGAIELSRSIPFANRDGRLAGIRIGRERNGWTLLARRISRTPSEDPIPPMHTITTITIPTYYFSLTLLQHILDNGDHLEFGI